MADVTLVNGQITDSITQTNLSVLGDAPAQALGVVYQTVAHSISLAMANAQHAQGCLAQIGNATTSAAVGVILAAARKANDDVS